MIGAMAWVGELRARRVARMAPQSRRCRAATHALEFYPNSAREGALELLVSSRHRCTVATRELMTAAGRSTPDACPTEVVFAEPRPNRRTVVAAVTEPTEYSIL